MAKVHDEKKSERAAGGILKVRNVGSQHYPCDFHEMPDSW